jgi:hypothetical protein
VAKSKKRKGKNDRREAAVALMVPLDLTDQVKSLIREHKREAEERKKPLDRKAYALDKKVVAEITKHIAIVQKLSGKLEKQGNKLNDIDRELSSKDSDWVDHELEKLGNIQEQIEDAQIDV